MWLKVFAFAQRGRKLAGRRETKTETGDSDFFFFWDAKESLCDVLLLAASAST